MTATTFRGRPVTVHGPRLRAGDPAPDCTVLTTDFTPVRLLSAASGVRIVSSVPSLDTDVCDQQTRRFHEEATRLGDVSVLTVSVDLPFAQRRWCAAAGLAGVRTLSDHRELAFGQAYGVAVDELRVLARAVFVLGPDDVVRYAQYVGEIGEHPAYDEVLAAVRRG
ncbi:thiol peroxidase [Actinoplanes sp. N902-109]|uniref:thiol peroxidase n=1 Tax=Actinoplanes sp. (strain N902-109) TaxID=649831 RepID=UPI00032958BF|nr:thiol peroxidase [Actinoplanes sp. N902-109]AGL16708.1 thioredoxin peroxidase [Actinoplanes sp. N902-109]